MELDLIPLDRCGVVGDEARWVQQAIADGRLGGGGEFGKRCEALLRAELGVSTVFLTASCTAALEMAATILNIGVGAEVVVPAFTFVSTAGAFARFGARPVFCDIDPQTLNLDAASLTRLFTPRTAAVVPVHYGGVGCEIDRITELANARGIPVIEDNAHGLFAKYKGRPLGSFGSLGALSFDRAKNFSCGEGGALLVNDSDLLNRAETVRDRGTNRARFLRGELKCYSWEDIGTNPEVSELAAAFLFGQLQARKYVEQIRWQVWHTYYRRLTSWAAANGVTLPHVPANCEPSHHIFYLIMPDKASQTGLIAHLSDRRITAAFHYPPLHLSKMGRRSGAKVGDCPVAESISDRLLRLPLYNSLAATDVDRVIDAVQDFRC